MVFKPFANLARSGLTKHLVNGGYAQSVVAATQSSSIPFAKLNTNPSTRLHSTFGNTNAPNRAPSHGGHDSLSTYYAVHGQQSEDIADKDAKRYLFSKKILWSKAQHQTRELHVEAEQESTPASQALPQIDVSTSNEDVSNLDTAALPGEAAKDSSDAVSSPNSSVFSVGSSGEESVPEYASTAPSKATVAFNKDLQKLMSQARYKDITLLYNHMIASGLEPTRETYNWVLSAISQLMHMRVLDNRIAHLLDVYADLLARKIIPDTKTYSILVQSLIKCTRAQEEAVASNKKAEQRFGFTVSPPQQLIVPATTEKQDGIKIALDLFYASTYVVKNRAYPVNVYTLLIDACAQRGLVDDMLKVYTQMEVSQVGMVRDTQFALMDGFAKSKDMHSALEVYEECKRALEKAEFVQFTDKHRLYKQLILAYISAEDPVGALSFLAKILDETVEKSDLIVEGFIEGFLRKGNYRDAYEWIPQLANPNGSLAMYWTVNVLSKASDSGDFEVANRAYEDVALKRFIAVENSQVEYNRQVWNAPEELNNARIAFLGLCIRDRKVGRTQAVWSDLLSANNSYHLGIVPTISYAKILFESGQTAKALKAMADLVTGVEAKYEVTNSQIHQLMEGWSHLINFLRTKGLLTSEIAGELWKIGGYNPESSLPVESVRTLIEVCHDKPLLEMTWAQLDLAMQLNSCFLIAGRRPYITESDVERFEQTVRVGMEVGWPIHTFTRKLISSAISVSENILQPAFARDWHAYGISSQINLSPTSALNSDTGAIAGAELYGSANEAASVEEVDPYWPKMDSKLSNGIDSTIDSKRNAHEVMKLFRGACRHGRLVRYQTISRVIAHTARYNNRAYVDEIYSSVNKLMPPIMQSRPVRQGWCCILDAMIAASLHFNDKHGANSFQQQLRSLGGVPSANTYGLFIVSLKDSHETFDEASEAVKIFEQSKAEHVFPTPFLYNAVIGKLARARRVDDCLYYFSEMRAFGLKPTSVTYGTMINALCRVSDERFAEELFHEMESDPKYKPRPAPYNSLIQYFATTKRDRTKVLAYYNRMISLGIEPTPHTYKLLIDAYASLDPPDITAAESIIKLMRSKNEPIQNSHYAALIHAKGCVLQDIGGATDLFYKVIGNESMSPDSTLYQALFEALVANHKVNETADYISDMQRRHVEMTPYIANTLIHGWALEKNIEKAKEIYDMLSPKTTDASSSSTNIASRREPSTYEAMTRAYLAVEDRNGAMGVVNEMMTRGYPTAVMSRIFDLVKGGGMAQTVIC